MRKEYFYIVILILSIAGVIGGIVSLLNLSRDTSEAKVMTNQVQMQNISETENTVTTASSEEKVSPNATFALKKYYDECSHFDYEEVELPNELVNLTEEEVQDFYTGWEIEEFSKDKLVLSKEVNGYCNQHFIIKLDDSMVNVYRVGTMGELNEYKTTDISKDYLPEEDIEKLEVGIPIYGEGKLGAALEDYE